MNIIRKLNDLKQNNHPTSKQSTKKTILSYLVESENLRRKQQELQQDNIYKENITLNNSIDSLHNADQEQKDTKKSRINNSNNKQKRNIKRNQSNRSLNKRLNSDEKSPRKKNKSLSEINRNSNKNANISNGLQTINQQKFSKNALFHSPTSILG